MSKRNSKHCRFKVQKRVSESFVSRNGTLKKEKTRMVNDWLKLIPDSLNWKNCVECFEMVLGINFLTNIINFAKKNYQIPKKICHIFHFQAITRPHFSSACKFSNLSIKKMYKAKRESIDLRNRKLCGVAKNPSAGKHEKRRNGGPRPSLHHPRPNYICGLHPHKHLFTQNQIKCNSKLNSDQNPNPKIQLYCMKRWTRPHRVESGQKSIEIGARSENSVEPLGGDEPQIERRRRRWHHPESVLHAHEKQQRRSENARHRMKPEEANRVVHRPVHERSFAPKPIGSLLLLLHLLHLRRNSAAVTGGAKTNGGGLGLVGPGLEGAWRVERLVAVHGGRWGVGICIGKRGRVAYIYKNKWWRRVEGDGGWWRRFQRRGWGKICEMIWLVVHQVLGKCSTVSLGFVADWDRFFLFIAFHNFPPLHFFMYSSFLLFETSIP